MTRIDFYILQQADLASRIEFACKLVQKTALMGHRIYIHCQDEIHAQAIDKMLWGFQPGSFLPHRIIGSGGADCAIEIGYNNEAAAPAEHHDVLINLGYGVPVFFSRFARLAEIVVQEANVLAATRDNYRFYAGKNYPLHRHNLE